MDLKVNEKMKKSLIPEVNKYPDAVKVPSVFPKRRQDVFTEYGWGYKDCYFTYEKDVARFTGKRYNIFKKNQIDEFKMIIFVIVFSDFMQYNFLTVLFFLDMKCQKHLLNY